MDRNFARIYIAGDRLKMITIKQRDDKGFTITKTNIV